MTGGRLRRVLSYVEDQDFCFTYGDGLSDVDITAAIAFHREQGTKATVTAVQPAGRFGAIDVEGERVSGFEEKPRGDRAWTNGGFFVLSPDVARYLDGDDDLVWEQQPMRALAADGAAFSLSPRGLLAADGHAARPQPARAAVGFRRCPMADVGMSAPVDPDFWRERRVLLTGHTGFKGAWLSLWLQSLGAQVTGFSVDVPTQPSLYELARVGEGMESIAGDVRDPEALAAAVAEAEPEIVIHMAAQSLVRRSFAEPRETYETNVMGTVNVLDAVRLHGSGVRAIVNVTSDKCYENREWEWGYREDEPMGGHDPYSSSKGCAELVTAAFRRSFFSDAARAAPGLRARRQRDRRRRLGRGPAGAGHHARGARRRACARAQPELDPSLAARAQPAQRLPGAGPGAVGLRRSRRRAGTSGPPRRTSVPVGWIVERIAALWPEELRSIHDDGPHPHEARYLKLDSSKARARLRLAPGSRSGGDAREHRGLVPRAARRWRHACGDAGTDRGVPIRCDPVMSQTLCRFCAAPVRSRLRGPRHVAAGELLPAARAGQQHGALLPAARARLREVLSSAARAVRDARADLLRLRLLLVLLLELA